MYSIKKIKSILGLHPDAQDDEHIIYSLEIDTRKIVDGQHALFFCLPGYNRDGHDYIEDAYQKGVRWMVVSGNVLPELKDVRYLQVPEVMTALHLLAKSKRNEAVNAEIIGLTGSNAKTIVKEWLFQMCHPSKKAIRSPKSFNSQIGVALSLWQLQKGTELGIIEAGISKKGEMKMLAELINPDLGIFTNIGDAHSAGFKDIEEKIAEKCRLFKNARKVMVCSAHTEIYKHLINKFGKDRVISWGSKSTDDYIVSHVNADTLKISWINGDIIIPVNGRGPHSLENLLHTIVASLVIGIEPNIILAKIPLLQGIEMRLEHIPGRNNSILINDAYIADIASLEVAMNHLSHTPHSGPVTVILSDFYDQKSDQQVYSRISELLKRYKVDRVITVGKQSKDISYNAERMHFNNTEDLLTDLEHIEWSDHLVLIKGSRNFQLDRIVARIEKSSHSAYLEIDIQALHHNLSEIRNHCPVDSGLIAVIKASAYGAGIEKIASAISDHDPAFFAVAYADEGVKLRNIGIKQPIIILNPDEDKVENLFKYDLEPVVHNYSILNQLSRSAEKYHQKIGIHIKLDTGMHRLGFTEEKLDQLLFHLGSNVHITVSTIFSHLSASESAEHDAFTHRQASLFEKWSARIIDSLGYVPGRHLLNSEGIWRFPEYAYDLVRAGITMYGISDHRKSLQKVHSLYAKIISIKEIKKGESIGYGRSEFLDKDKLIGVINIGYSDGLMRAGSNGKTSVLVNGVRCPVAGKICMDVAMIDLSGCPNVVIGDNAEVFGKKIQLEVHASQINTIPYEILCNISPRIVRRYIMD